MDITSRKLHINGAIQTELDTISLLLIRGLQELQAMDMNYGSYFMPSQTLSQGLERMMKVILFLSGKAKKGQLKDKFSHSLNRLWHKLTIEKIVDLITDPYFDDILNILSEFGYHARYYYISILDGDPLNFNPQEEWENLENKFLNENPQRYQMFLNGDDANILIKEMVRRLQIPIEMLINRLSKVIVDYEKSEVGWVVPTTIKFFADIGADSFGKNIYKEWPQSLVTFAKPHKRNWSDFLIRLFHPFRKSKVISKRDYQGEWPFRNVKKVRIEKRMSKSGPLHIITINGFDFALDGKTAAILKIARTHEAGFAVVGKSTQPFLNLAKKL